MNQDSSRWHLARYACWLLAVAFTASGAEPPGFFSWRGRDPESLPADKLYPQGRIFPFSGFSGDAAREKANAFTAFGPVYGDQSGAYAAARKAGLLFFYRVGIGMNFLGKKGAPKLVRTADQIREEIAGQVRLVADDAGIAWWYLIPEEMRHWQPDEMM